MVGDCQAASKEERHLHQEPVLLDVQETAQENQQMSGTTIASSHSTIFVGQDFGGQ